MKSVVFFVISLYSIGLFAQHPLEFGISQNNKHSFSCKYFPVKERSAKGGEIEVEPLDYTGKQPLRNLRKIKIAIVATGEYSHYVIKKNKAENLGEQEQKKIITQAIQKSLATVNQIFERDVAIKFKLIGNNDKLIFLNPEEDGLTPESPVVLLSQAADVLDALVGRSDYDIAHVFSTAYGGLSYYKGAFSDNRALGVTGAPTPEGKVFDVDFLAHELGHQLGASHTQNSNCNRSSYSSVEAGSGATIMGYAGICNVNGSNVTENSLPYFHEVNMLQINKFVEKYFKSKNEGKSYGLEKIPDYEVPLNTPFEVILNNDLPEKEGYYFSCNQVDKEYATFPPSAVASSGPVFSAHELTQDNVFYFPKLPIVLANNVASKQGVLSKVPRSYRFLASVRGGNSNKKLLSFQNFKVHVVDAAPFKLTAQDKENLKWYGGETHTVTWEVGGSNSVLKYSHVDVLLSVDNGERFDYVLAQKVPNTGRIKVTVPVGINSTNCRIKIKPKGAIFYAINEQRFSISTLTEQTVSNFSHDANANASSNQIEIKQAFPYEFFEVSVNVYEEQLSETRIILQSPDKKEVVLWDGFCTNGSKLEVRFGDAQHQTSGKILNSNRHTWVCDDVIQGFKLSKEALFSVKCNNKGNWRLKIIDNNGEIMGVNRLNWSLHFFTNDSLNQLPMVLKNRVEVYPNPILDEVTISTSDEKLESGVLKLFDFSGNVKKVFPYQLFEQNTFDFSGLNAGVYLLQLTAKESSIVKKIIVK